MGQLALINVSKEFGGKAVVKDLSLEVEQGEFLFVLGPSGCGKTTLLRMMAGLDHPTRGRIVLNGRVVNGLPTYKRNTAMVFQSWGLFPHKTVYDNVAFGLRMRGLPRPDVKSRVEQTLHLVELDGYQHRMPHQLSGGEQQRVALARALIVEPDVLLLDEPFSNLDHRLRQQMRLELCRIQKKLAVTSVFVTHDPQEALSMADRLVIMRQGRLEQAGTPFEVYQHPRSEFVAGFTGELNLFFGTVSGADHPRHAVVTTQERLSIHIPKESVLEEGQAVSVSVRPAQVEFMNGNAASKPNAFGGAIYHRAYLGSAMRYYVQLDQGATVFVDRALELDAAPLEVGARVCVGWDVDRCLCFPKR